jgi:hypothetical protein
VANKYAAVWRAAYEGDGARRKRLVANGTIHYVSGAHERNVGDGQDTSAKVTKSYMLFQVLTEGEEQNSVAIASNESFGGWTKTFSDPRLCAAIVDRLSFGGNIIETGTASYRLARTRTLTTA